MPQKKTTTKKSSKKVATKTTSKAVKAVSTVKVVTPKPSVVQKTQKENTQHVSYEQSYKRSAIAMMITLYFVLLFLVFVWFNYDIMLYPKG